MTRRCLFIAYLFPPVGGAGVQRAAKFAKYLPQFGWRPTILTVSNPSVPLYDQSLAAELQPDLHILRARTFEPAYATKAAVSASGHNGHRSLGRFLKRAARRLGTMVLQPDPQVLWIPQAVKAGMKLLRETPHDAIIATAPPFSSLLVGAILSRRTGLPLVLDYRDEWSLSSAVWENKCLDPISRRIQNRMQRRAVRRASVLVATTRSSASALREVRDQSNSNARVTWIYNGFDPDDFRTQSAAAIDDDVYRLAYVGTLWNLTSAEPLVTAVERLAGRAPHLVAKLELIFAGRRTAAQQQIIDRLSKTPCRVTEHPYLDHSAAVELIQKVDGLCVLLSDLPGAERVVPAKIFEYMATRRPILSIAPFGETQELLNDYPAAHRYAPAAVSDIADCLAREIERKRDGEIPYFNGYDPSRHDRRHQAQQLARILDDLAAGKS